MRGKCLGGRDGNGCQLLVLLGVACKLELLMVFAVAGPLIVMVVEGII